MGGQVNVLFSEMLTAAPHLKSGKLRIVAQIGETYEVGTVLGYIE